MSGRAQDGMAHFLEHMAFKGTKTRSAFDIVEQIEQVGGDLNAATGLDQTAYYATILKDDLALAVELLWPILSSTRCLTLRRCGRERRVIIQEILALSTDSPEDEVFDLAQERAFPGQAVGRPVMGRIETVSKIEFNRISFQQFMERHYRAKTMVLSAAGNVDHDELCRAGGAAFRRAGHRCRAGH